MLNIKKITLTLMIGGIFGVYGTEIEVGTGGVHFMDAGPFSDVTFKSTSSNTTGSLQTDNNAGIAIEVILNNPILTDFYGPIKVGDKDTLILSGATTSSSTNGYFEIGSANTATTTLKLNAIPAFSISDNSTDSIKMSKYSVLDLSTMGSNLTLSKGLYMADYNDTNAPYILMSAKNTITCTSGKIYTDETEGKIYPSKHLRFDMTGVSENGRDEGSFISHTVIQCSVAPALDTTNVVPTLENGGKWYNPIVEVSGNNIILKTYFSNTPVKFLKNNGIIDVKYSSWAELVQDLLSDDVATPINLQANCEMIADKTLTNSSLINLGGYTLGGDSTAKILTIDAGKTLVLNGTTNGVFNGKIDFGSTASTLKVLKDGILGSSEMVSTAKGILEIGDGTASLTYSHTLVPDKLSKIKVNNSAILKLRSNS